MSELVLGAVAYDPKVVTTWDSFRAWLREQGLPFDYILYSNYERQVEELIAGRIQLAWNSALAWVRALRLGRSGGVTLQPVMMRDTDCGLSSVIVVRQDSAAQSVKDLRGLVVATGAVDSPQATLLPLSLLREAGLEPNDERLKQELALFATRIDVAEEVARLATHVAEIRRVLAQGGSVGKRLDFLAQELHREANTLGSKSVDAELSQVSLELKVLIEQMREQVQNLE